MAEETSHTMTATNQFLTTFSDTVPKLFITAETDSMAEFDQITLKHWRAEGFDITYIPFGNGGKEYADEMKSIARTLPLGEYYGIIGT
jgi:hypothetical protein